MRTRRRAGCAVTEREAGADASRRRRANGRGVPETGAVGVQRADPRPTRTKVTSPTTTASGDALEFHGCSAVGTSIGATPGRPAARRGRRECPTAPDRERCTAGQRSRPVADACSNRSDAISSRRRAATSAARGRACTRPSTASRRGRPSPLIATRSRARPAGRRRSARYARRAHASAARPSARHTVEPPARPALALGRSRRPPTARSAGPRPRVGPRAL